jgi:hypothetical protein
MRRKYHRWIIPFPTCSILDPDFEDDDGKILTGMHPDAWGVHDYLGVKSAEMPQMLSKLDDEPKQAPVKFLAPILPCYNPDWPVYDDLYHYENIPDATIRERIRYEVCWYPHADLTIASWTTDDFVAWGQQEVRNSPNPDSRKWLWEHSKGLAEHGERYV